MDIVEFSQRCIGKWFSQRTGHDPVDRQSSVAKADLWVEDLAATAPEGVKLCAAYQVEPAQIVAGLKLRWEATTAAPKKEFGTSVLLLLGQAGDRSGLVLASAGGQASRPRPGQYAIGNDGALTLVLPIDGGHIEERIWFASDNLRFRSSSVVRSTGMTAAAFWSEIRLGSAPAAPAA